MLIDYAVGIFYGYLLIGAVFGVYFVCFAAARIDPDAHGMPFALRLLLWPASVALWPVLLWKVLQQKSIPDTYLQLDLWDDIHQRTLQTIQL